MNLVIVESPAKAKTIEKYLGQDYKVLASFGHLRDLPKEKLGIDVKNNYEPEYIIPDKSTKTLSLLKKEAKKAEKLYLATDLDREGEAISWHLLAALSWKKDYGRITFSEITKNAITEAIKNPRMLNMNLVDAQQARRVLDRLVGYKLSPLLWKKVRRGLSAGRVQSVAVRLIVEKEREIKSFIPTEYWQISVELSKKDEDNKKFRANLSAIDNNAVGKLQIKSSTEASQIKDGLSGADYIVKNVESRESYRKPSAPFTTSTLQMEASRKLGYSAKQTMMLAQKLYEAGKITYMRTDSTNLSQDAVLAIRKKISNDYGEKYLPGSANSYQTKTKRAQEAHEAIRPSDIEIREASIEAREQKLYDLIWKRAIASQMADAIFDVVEINIEAKTDKIYQFTAKGESLKFDGFSKVYTEGKDDEIDEDKYELPALEINEKLIFWQLFADQKFTEPPKRYSEATLVKKLESLGIGRPSTYAPTIATIQERGYVVLENKRFVPVEIGEIVNDLLVKYFSNIVDYDFTAKMEDKLDEIAEGGEKWQEVIDKFYQPFSKDLAEKSNQIDKSEIVGGGEIDEKCPECGKNLIIRLGRYGKFISCTGYPECKYSRPLETKEDREDSVVDKDGKAENLVQAEHEKCEKCGGKMLLKEGRYGKFLACENYPKCKNTKTIVKDTGIKCPECKEGEIVERKTKKGRLFWGCSRYPECKYATWEKPVKDVK